METSGISIGWILPIYTVALIVAGLVAFLSLKMEKRPSKTLKPEDFIKPRDSQSIIYDTSCGISSTDETPIKLTPRALDLEACEPPILAVITHESARKYSSENSIDSREEGTLKREASSSSHYQLFYDEV